MGQTGIKKWDIYAAVKSYFKTSIGSLKIKQLLTDILTGVHFDQSSLFLSLQAKWTQNPCACDII